jgi:hypothetical protein
MGAALTTCSTTTSASSFRLACFPTNILRGLAATRLLLRALCRAVSLSAIATWKYAHEEEESEESKGAKRVKRIE